MARLSIDLTLFMEICDEFWVETNAKLGWTFAPRHPKEKSQFSTGCDFDEDVHLTKKFVQFLNDKLKGAKSKPSKAIQIQPALSGELIAVPTKHVELMSSDASTFIATYVKAFQVRFPGARPELGGKVQGQIKTFLRDRTLTRACDLIQVFFQMEDEWFKTKAYDFTTFMENLQKVSIALDTGKEAGKQDPFSLLRKDVARDSGSV